MGQPRPVFQLRINSPAPQDIFPMLAHILAIAVALGSCIFYIAAFFFPEIHRPRDLVWSGVGLFYALVLWVCAGRITGGVLLGQTASVALLGWLGWQTLTLRQLKTPLLDQTEVAEGTVAQVKQRFKLGALFQRKSDGKSKPVVVADPPEAVAEATPGPESELEAVVAEAPTPASEPEMMAASTPEPDGDQFEDFQESSSPTDVDPLQGGDESEPEPEQTAVDPAAPVPSLEPEAVPLPLPEASSEPDTPALPTISEVSREDFQGIPNEDLSNIPEPDVVKDLEALADIADTDIEGDTVIKAEVVKDTDPDAWG